MVSDNGTLVKGTARSSKRNTGR